MDIRINGRTVNSSRPVYIGVEADNNVLDLVFAGLPEIGGGQLVTLNWLTDGDTPVGDIEAMSKTEAGYAYTVKSGLTQFAGYTVRAYIEVKSGDKSWHTDPFLLDATDLPEVEANLEPTDPTIIQQVKDALEQANAAATRAEEAAKRAEEAGGGGGIYEEQLQEAVESALSQAKESGEFDGKDGFSPTVTVEDITGGHRVTITDESGQKVFDVEDGSDAAVTAKNIEAALGYTPANPSDIPAPYTLPAATADTLGGVKVGNGLAINRNGVLETINGGKFELIEEFVLDADVMSVSRSLFPDGTPYNLISLIIRIDTNGINVTETAEGWIRLNASKNNDECAYVAPGIIVQQDRKVSYFVYRKLPDGSVDSYYRSIGNDTPTGYASVGDGYVVVGNVKLFNYTIYDFSLYSTTNVIPTGTKITVWGVRA